VENREKGLFFAMGGRPLFRPSTKSFIEVTYKNFCKSLSINDLRVVYEGESCLNSLENAINVMM